MGTLFMAAPILPDKVEAWRRLCQEIQGHRQADYQESREQLGIGREAVWLMQTSRSNMAIVRLDAAEPEHLLSRLAASNHEFDRWLKDQLLRVCGLDLRPASLGPTMELVVDWRKME